MTTNHFDGPFLAIPVWAVETIRERGHARDLQVLTGLVGCMDLRTRTITASFAQVAEFIGTSRETVKRSVKWLEAQGIITVARTANSVNHYTIVYDPRRGVTGDPPGGHGRPHPGSRVTLPSGGRGVTGDPTKIDVSPAQGGNPENTEIYNNREVFKRNESGPQGGEGDEMILGEDPHEAKTVTPPKETSRKPKRDTLSLANQFMYHPKSLMSRNYTSQDRIVLMALFRKLLDAKVTRATISRMINAYWEHPTFSKYHDPVNAFSSNAIQKTLMETIDVKVADDNAVLRLMSNDFDRGDENLPWPESADKDLSKAVMMRCMDALYRYPEVVADIAMLWNGDFTDREFLDMLTALNDLVLWHCAQEQVDIKHVVDVLSSLNLPEALTATEPTMLRPPAGTIGEAIYNYRRSVNG